MPPPPTTDQTKILGDCDTLLLPNCTETNGLPEILSLIFFITGAAAALFIIIGAVRFSIFGADPAKAKQARDTIVFAVAGLIISIAAFAIVIFVLGNL